MPERRASRRRRDRAEAARASAADVRINDFALKLANVNGTGSASANGLLMQAIFRMGIPVSGKNLFPSNIQGLPTWYEIRVNKGGHVARALDYDLVVAMNARDLRRATSRRSARAATCSTTRPGRWTRRSRAPTSPSWACRSPQMCNEIFKELARADPDEEHRLRWARWSALLDIDMRRHRRAARREVLARRRRCASRTTRRCALGYDYAKEHLDVPAADPAREDARDRRPHPDRRQHGDRARLRLRRRDGGRLVPDHAVDVGDGRVQGVLHDATGSDPETGKNNFCILQAEDELAAIGMVIGASWNGARAFTSTSGPGISLMSELIGLAYYAEIPAVIVDVQRTGPSTGMPTRTQQGDIMMCAYASHGDTKHIVLFPANPEECFTLAVAAFDLAERFQTPVFVLSDLDIGMNDWVVPALQVGRQLPPRPRPGADAPPSWRRWPSFHRYADEDADHVAARTLPGRALEGRVLHARLGPQQVRRLHRDPGRVPGGHGPPAAQAPGRGARPSPSRPSACRPTRRSASSRVGGCDPAVREAVAAARRARHRRRLHARPRLPVRRDGREVPRARTIAIFVVEQNRDAQLRVAADARDRASPKEKLRSVLVYGGFPLSSPARGRRRHQPAGAELSHMPDRRNQRSPTRTCSPNELGLTLRDYEGAMSTLCAGCGHDSVTAAIVRAFYELDTPPHMIAKLSGIGCSSKTPTYFVSGAHGFNSAHGRMPSIATGADAANRELTYIGISGDGDSLSIGLGQLAHAIRRNVDMLYVIENNGVYGLTKGQFSASADVGSKSKRGEANRFAPIDPVRAGARTSARRSSRAASRATRRSSCRS